MNKEKQLMERLEEAEKTDLNADLKLTLNLLAIFESKDVTYESLFKYLISKKKDNATFQYALECKKNNERL